VTIDSNLRDTLEYGWGLFAVYKGFDIHKGYDQSTSNKKVLEVFKHTSLTNKASEVHKRTPMTN
jgi:hypothetical protein